MRAFLDSILTFITCSTLSDDEWLTVDALNDASYIEANYLALLTVLIERDSVSSARDRLKYYFLAAGLSLADVNQDSSVPSDKSDVYIGSVL